MIIEIIKQDKCILTIMGFILLLLISISTTSHHNKYKSIEFNGKIINSIDKLSKNNERYMILKIEDFTNKSHRDMFCFNDQYKTCDNLRYNKIIKFKAQQQEKVLKFQSAE